MIPRRSISLISNSLMSAGGRRIPEAVIERDYVLAWLLSGLAGHPLRELLAFKGGTALRRCWFADYRFSEDLDFTLTRPISLEEILARLNEIFVAIEAACGLRIEFDRDDRHGHQNSHTFYLRYQGPLPAANDVKVDITIDEVLCFPLQDRVIQRTYDSFDDLPEGPTVKVYAVEEIVIEKLLALCMTCGTCSMLWICTLQRCVPSSIQSSRCGNALPQGWNRQSRPKKNVSGDYGKIASHIK